MTRVVRPVTPHFGQIAFYMAVFGSVSALGLGLWSGGASWRGQAISAAYGLALTFSGLGITLLGVPIHHQLGRRLNSHLSPAARWLLFGAIFALLAISGGFLRAGVAAALGDPGWSARMNLPVNLLLTMSVAFWFERDAAYHRTVDLQEAESETAVRELMRSEIALDQARHRRQTTFDRLVEHDIRPKLQGIRAALDRPDLVGSAGSSWGLALGDLADRLDAIRERDVREVSHLLHPSILHAGLGAALLSLASRYDDHVTVHLVCDPPLGTEAHTIERELDPAVRLSLYRIVEDAFEAILQESEAQRVDIGLRLDDRCGIDLVIADDGPGQWPGALSDDSGLLMIGARIAMLDGTWTLATTASPDLALAGGTVRPRLTVHVPFRRSSPRPKP